MAVTTSNWQSYLSQNPDLTAAGIKDEAGAMAHWNNYGKNEAFRTPYGATSGPQMSGISNLPTTPEASTNLGLGLPTGYSAAQQMMANNAQNAKGTDIFQTMGGFGKGVSIQQLRDFFATNPSNDQILQQASNLGMGSEEMARAMVYGRGDTLNDLASNEMVNGSRNYGYDAEGHIVPLNGAQKYSQNGNSQLTIAGGGSGYGGGGYSGSSGGS